MDFESAYKSLNKAQQEAVDTIDGPVLVVAGPGTGKTQLLATRAANILRKDSTLLPTNVLCLTFTESGQVAMQRRLIELMGEAGAHVAVHTFHSFGTEIINTYPQYFYQGANYSPADELTTHEILVEILQDLPFKNPLITKNQAEFVYLHAVKERIAELKKNALEPQELRSLAMDSLKFIDYIESPLIELFDMASFSKASDIARADKVLTYANKYNQPKLKLVGFKPLSKIFIDTFGETISRARLLGKPKPINDWKKDWFAKDNRGRAVCKQRDILDKLLALSEVYEIYQQDLDKRKLFDYDDMIMRVVHALETKADLAYELQEQYQYFLVDEFQDTNAGQLRLLTALASHPVNEGRPNVLVVGDDDQAIYAFQGAELSNILGFKESYVTVKMITLTDNYRSSQKILNVSRQIIVQGVERLENRFKDLDKSLTAKNEPRKTGLQRQLFTSQAHEYEWVANEINNLITSGQNPREIAVICREHKYLESLLPYLYDHDIPVAYERRQNALDQNEIKTLIDLARLVNYLSTEDNESANGMIPQVLSADYWQIPPETLWRLSLTAQRHWQKEHQEIYWLELMLSGKFDESLKKIAQFLLDAAKKTRNHSLEEILDLLTGNEEKALAQNSNEEFEENLPTHKAKFNSPFKDYYFSKDLLIQKPDKYLNLLSGLAAIRNHLRRYRADTKLNLNDFINFVDLCNEAKVVINVTGFHSAQENSVQVLTAHGSKGLEFETVFILSAVGKIWDSKGRGSLLQLAPNMLAIAHKDNPDDNLRLFYVAMTRTKKNLYITSYLTGEDGKEVTSFGALEDLNITSLLPTPTEPTLIPDTEASRINRVERQWYDRHYALPSKTMRELLNSRLETYNLSVTHLNNFLDVTNGGPLNFLLGNLLQFPSTMSPSAAFGSAMHDSLDHLHKYFAKNQKPLKEKDLLDYFSASLKLKRMNQKDEKLYMQKGQASLKQFLMQRGRLLNSNQQTELNFFNQGTMIGNARLTGRLDVLEINKLKAKVIDYKTGKDLPSWDPRGKNDYERAKMHRYKQQLFFYKLLVDNSRSWGDKGIKLNEAELIFVEPNREGEIKTLPLDLDNQDEIERLKILIKAVWQRIQNLDFLDINGYEKNVKGIIAFENWLIDNYK